MSAPAAAVGIIGAGHMGERHARAWRDLGARVVAVFDPDAERAAALAAEVGAEAAVSMAGVFDRDDIGVVSVCTPTVLHPDATVAALESGKHVLCEKPVALALAGAERMRRAASASGRLLRIGFLRRFDPASLRLLELAPRLGRPLMAGATLSAGIRPKLLMHDAGANGGPVIDMCCHLFDQWRFLFGERPSSVRAVGAILAADKPQLAAIRHKAIDSAQITLRYPSGGVGHIFVSWGLPAGVEALERHSYLGPDGRIEIDWPQRLTLDGAHGPLEEVLPEIDPLPRQIEAFERDVQDWSSSCEAPEIDRSRVATLEDGIEALRLSLATLASIARDGDEIVLDTVRSPAGEWA